MEMLGLKGTVVQMPGKGEWSEMVWARTCRGGMMGMF